MRSCSITCWFVLCIAVTLALATLSSCQREDAARSAANANPNVLEEPQTGLDFPKTTLLNERSYEAVHTSTLDTRVLGIHTYSAGVGYYVETGSWSASGNAKQQLLERKLPKLLVLGFVRTTPAGALRELFWDSINARMPEAYKPENERDIRAVIDGFEDLQRGDVIQFVWLPNGELEMLVKKTTRAKVTNAALAWTIWGLFLP